MFYLLLLRDCGHSWWLHGYCFCLYGLFSLSLKNLHSNRSQNMTFFTFLIEWRFVASAIVTIEVGGKEDPLKSAHWLTFHCKKKCSMIDVYCSLYGNTSICDCVTALWSCHVCGVGFLTLVKVQCYAKQYYRNVLGALICIEWYFYWQLS